MAKTKSPAVKKIVADIPGSVKTSKAKAKTQSADKSRRSYLPAVERRRSIIEAAQEVFSRTNLQGTRTRDLAKAAGVNQATLYGHFESKEELFAEAVVQPMVDAMRGMYERASSYENAESSAEFMQTAKGSVQNHLQSMANIYPLLTSALFSDPEVGGKLYREHIAPLFVERGEVMKNAVKEGIDPEMLALFAFGMFFAVAMDRNFTGKDTDLAEVADQLTKLSTFGFAKERFRE